MIYSLKQEEKELIETIKRQTDFGNEHNISRTTHYDQFYKRHNEIIWAYLASFVSRNAGWNMTDLEGEIFKNLIPKKYREILFLTYERANWLIFSDAFPQLLLYEASKQLQKPCFHLLKFFHVSRFMEWEWNKFWIDKDIDRLCTALIINEQHVIQKPVIENRFFQDHVFGNISFFIEERMHFSTVIFPTLEGNLYGYSVHGFNKVKNRINLGKQLAWLLFYSKEHRQMRQFASSVEHTGSRYDYEQFVGEVKRKRTPKLLDVYPLMYHHRSDFTDWYNKKNRKIINQYFRKIKILKKYNLTKWYYKKQRQLKVSAKLEQRILTLLKKWLD